MKMFIVVIFSFLLIAIVDATVLEVPSKYAQSGYYIQSLHYAASDPSCAALPFHISYFALGTCHHIRSDDTRSNRSVLFGRDPSNNNQLWQRLYSSTDCSGMSVDSIIRTLSDTPSCSLNKKLNYYQKQHFYAATLPTMTIFSLARIQYILCFHVTIILSALISCWYVFAFSVMIVVFTVARGKTPILWKHYFFRKFW